METGSQLIDIPKALEACRQPLLDTGGRSRLINFPLNGRKTKRWLRVIGEDPDEVFDRLVIRGQPFSFRPLPGRTPRGDQAQDSLLPADDDLVFTIDHKDSELQVDRYEDTLDGCLETIAREARFSLDETGVNMLYLAVGLLEWYQSEDSQESTYAPLILVPVELRKEFSERQRKNIYPLQHNGQELQSNLSLAKRLEEDFGYKMPMLDDGQTPAEYFDSIRRDVLVHQPRWKVLDQMVLASFRFKKQLLYLDLDPKNWSNSRGRIDNAQLRKVFEGVERNEDSVSRQEDELIDENQIAQKTQVVMDADSSQHSALCDIASGHDLVIEGPPGTGKSQTIINAIASTIAQGKTVLFVAEKLAALTVVYDRMKELGLGDLCLNLHSDQATPKRVFDDLGRRLNVKFRSPRELQSVRRELQGKRKTLGAYLEATRKHAGPLDLPLHDVFWRAARLGSQGAPLLRDEGDPTITREAFNDSITALRALSQHIAEIGSLTDCPWWDFECHQLPQADIPLLTSHLERMLAAAEDISQQSDVLDGLVSSRNAWFSTLQSVEASQTQLLEEVTSAVNIHLCHLIADSARAEAARDLLTDLHEYMAADTAASTVCSVDWSECTAQAKKFNAIFADRFHKPIGVDVTVENLMMWRSRLTQSLDILDRIESLMTQLHTLGFDHANDLSHVKHVTDIYRLITDDLVLHSGFASENLLLASAEREYQRSRDQHQGLESRYKELSKTFAMSDAPLGETLGPLRRNLRPYVHRWHRWLWSEYRRAKTDLMRFISPTAKRDLAQWVSKLDDLELWQQDVEAFAVDKRLVSGLGPAFAGWDTRWDLMEHLVRWGKTLASRGIEGRRAIELLLCCEQCEDRPHLADLQGATRQLEHELSALPPAMFGEHDTSELFQKQFGTLRSQLDRWRSDIENLMEAAAGFRQEPTTTLGQLSDAATCVKRAVKLKKRIDGSGRYRHALPRFFTGTQTSVPVLEVALALIDRLMPLRLSTPVLQWLFDAEPEQRAAALREGLDEWIARRDLWFKRVDESGIFGSCPTHWFGNWHGNPDKQPPATIRHLLANTDILPAWIEFCRSRQRCETIGLAPWIQAVAEKHLPPDQMVACFDRTVHDAVARMETQRDERLRQFSRQEHEQIRTEFAELDRQLIQLQRDEVRWLAGNREPPTGNSTGRVGGYTQMGLIQHVAETTNARCTLRSLIGRAGGALSALKPCWMMSPLSVAQFIEPGAVVFHLLLMDEASQIKPEDALGSIARAEQVVVVGDPKQMPPSTWMQRMGGDTDEDDDAEEKTLADDNESILEWGMSAYRRVRRLKWHYRSQHESLIAFSNEKFYDRELVIFPAPSKRNQQLGLRFHHVADGRWEKRCNVVEARQVAEAIVRHAHEQPDATLGIATFNAPQMEIIEEELDRLTSADSEARHAVDQLKNRHDHEKLFIKNVENLQGDERDVIFISYTYGPDAGGVVAQRFYPINTQKGWRRFNVLITRARQRIEVFSSMLPEQIHHGPDRPRGVRCMSEYLTYARDGILVDIGTQTGRPPDSDFEIAVAGVVQRMGYEVHAQVGVAGYFIDLAVLVPDASGDYLLGIECDGATYHSAKSARDRDRLRQEVIERRGWSLYRIWSTDWFRNQTSEEVRLQKAIEKLLAMR